LDTAPTAVTSDTVAGDGEKVTRPERKRSPPAPSVMCSAIGTGGAAGRAGNTSGPPGAADMAVSAGGPGGMLKKLPPYVGSVGKIVPKSNSEMATVYGICVLDRQCAPERASEGSPCGRVEDSRLPEPTSPRATC